MIYSTGETTTTETPASIFYSSGQIKENKKWYEFFKKKKEYSVDEFFNLIKGGLEETDYKKANKHKKEIIETLKQAEILEQKSLIEKLNKQLVGFQKEVKSISKGFNKYVFEGDISDLESNGIEGRLIYRKSVKEYVGIIPKDVSKNILKAKDIFDEIIIIYTRKKERIVELDKSKKTSKEKRNKVDPICFGVIKETNKLFIIGDWVDDECDFDCKKLEALVKIKEI